MHIMLHLTCSCTCGCLWINFSQLITATFQADSNFLRSLEYNHGESESLSNADRPKQNATGDWGRSNRVRDKSGIHANARDVYHSYLFIGGCIYMYSGTQFFHSQRNEL